MDMTTINIRITCEEKYKLDKLYNLLRKEYTSKPEFYQKLFMNGVEIASNEKSTVVNPTDY